MIKCVECIYKFINVLVEKNIIWNNGLSTTTTKSPPKNSNKQTNKHKENKKQNNIALNLWIKCFTTGI